MDRFGTKGYGLDHGGRKRVQLPGDHVKGTQPGFSYASSNLYHSTPKAKPTSVSTTVVSSTFKPRTTNSSYHSPTAITSMRASRSKSPLRSTSPLGRRSTSPARRSGSPSRIISTSPLSPSKQLSDVDSDTIQRQRRELQLLIGELKDRDRELNDMVQAHQKQIIAWEDDRQRVFSLEKRCSRLQSELKSKAEQMKALQARLKASEVEEHSKNKELEDTQVQLHQVSEQANTSLHQVQDLEEKNTSLTSTMRELSNTIGQLQAREQELTTRLKLKDNDIMEATVRLGELQQKIRRLESLCQDLRKGESSLKSERDQWKDQALANKNEVDRLRGDINKQFSDADEIQAEMAKTNQEVLVLQKELFLSGEREKRKDQLLELQKSKQERTDSELQNLRQICERQQRDISYMQMQIQNSHDSVLKAESEVGTAYPDDKQTGGGYYDDKTNYNTEFDNQDVISTKSLDFEDKDPLPSYKPDGVLRITGTNGYDDVLAAYLPAGPTGVPPASNYATAGSDFGDDLESLSQENDRPYTSTGNTDTYTGTRTQSYYEAPSSKPEVYSALGGLSISGTRPVVDKMDGGSYMAYPRGPDLSSVGTARPTNGYGAYSTSTPQAAGQAEDSSPTSKLHRLLAESRQMVQNLEQVSTFPISASPGQQDPGRAADQFTPPQRHLGSPLTSHALTNPST